MTIGVNPALRAASTFFLGQEQSFRGGYAKPLATMLIP
jgi:hypothetical protein